MKRFVSVALAVAVLAVLAGAALAHGPGGWSGQGGWGGGMGCDAVRGSYDSVTAADPKPGL